MEHQTADYTDSLRSIAAGIETELKRLELWTAEEPEETALASEQPFHYDTMHFHQWLQWVFLPNVTDIADGREQIPEKSQILPYAEESLGQYGRNEEPLVFLIRTFDELVGMINRGGRIAPDD